MLDDRNRGTDERLETSAGGKVADSDDLRRCVDEHVVRDQVFGSRFSTFDAAPQVAPTVQASQDYTGGNQCLKCTFWDRFRDKNCSDIVFISGVFVFAGFFIG